MNNIILIAIILTIIVLFTAIRAKPTTTPVVAGPVSAGPVSAGPVSAAPVSAGPVVANLPTTWLPLDINNGDYVMCNGNAKAQYKIENNKKRYIPDVATATYLHLSNLKVYDCSVLDTIPTGDAYPPVSNMFMALGIGQ